MPTKKNCHQVVAVAAFLAALGVALGAFGAHALKAELTATGMLSTWETAVFYHLLHALGMFTASLAQASSPTPLARALNRACWCWLAGVILFSGSLYGLSLGGPRIPLGPITPLGGLAFIGGWMLLGVAFARQKTDPAK